MKKAAINVLTWVAVVMIVGASFFFAIVFHTASCESIRETLPYTYAPSRCIR